MLTAPTSCTHTGGLGCQNLNAGFLNDLERKRGEKKGIIYFSSFTIPVLEVPEVLERRNVQLISRAANMGSHC